MQADFSVELGGEAPALEIPWSSNDPCVRYYDLKKHPELVQEIPEAAAHPELGAFLSRINAAEFPLATAKCDAWSSSEVAPEEEIFGDRKFVSYVDLIFVDESERCSFAKHEAFAKELCLLLSQAPEIAATVELVIRHCYYHHRTLESENGPEQGDSLSKNVKDDGMNLPGNEDTMNQGRQFDVARCGKHTDIALQKGKAEHLDNTAPSDNTVKKGRLDKTVPSHKIRGSGKTEWSRTKCPPPLGEIGDVQMEPKLYHNEPNSSVVGYCLTAYVTGFGDCDHDPLRRWTIGLNLLQHAIVQLNSKLQPKL
jgi:hypothetical protein